jgi:hypothetical protein
LPFLIILPSQTILFHRDHRLFSVSISPSSDLSSLISSTKLGFLFRSSFQRLEKFRISDPSMTCIELLSADNHRFESLSSTDDGLLLEDDWFKAWVYSCRISIRSQTYPKAKIEEASSAR